MLEVFSCFLELGDNLFLCVVQADPSSAVLTTAPLPFLLSSTAARAKLGQHGVMIVHLCLVLC